MRITKEFISTYISNISSEYTKYEAPFLTNNVDGAVLLKLQNKEMYSFLEKLGVFNTVHQLKIASEFLKIRHMINMNLTVIPDTSRDKFLTKEVIAKSVQNISSKSDEYLKYQKLFLKQKIDSDVLEAILHEYQMFDFLRDLGITNVVHQVMISMNLNNLRQQKYEMNNNINFNELFEEDVNDENEILNNFTQSTDINDDSENIEICVVSNKSRSNISKYKGNLKAIGKIINLRSSSKIHKINKENPESTLMQVKLDNISKSKFTSNALVDPSLLKQGTNVEVNYRGKGTWMKGVIDKRRPDSSYDIDYADGSEENYVPLKNIRFPDSTISSNNEAKIADTMIRIVKDQTIMKNMKDSPNQTIDEISTSKLDIDKLKDKNNDMKTIADNKNKDIDIEVKDIPNNIKDMKSICRTNFGSFLQNGGDGLFQVSFKNKLLTNKMKSQQNNSFKNYIKITKTLFHGDCNSDVIQTNTKSSKSNLFNISDYLPSSGTFKNIFSYLPTTDKLSKIFSFNQAQTNKVESCQKSKEMGAILPIIFESNEVARPLIITNKDKSDDLQSKTTILTTQDVEPESRGTSNKINSSSKISVMDSKILPNKSISNKVPGNESNLIATNYMSSDKVPVIESTVISNNSNKVPVNDSKVIADNINITNKVPVIETTMITNRSNKIPVKNNNISSNKVVVESINSNNSNSKVSNDNKISVDDKIRNTSVSMINNSNELKNNDLKSTFLVEHAIQETINNLISNSHKSKSNLIKSSSTTVENKNSINKRNRTLIEKSSLPLNIMKSKENILTTSPSIMYGNNFNSAIIDGNLHAVKAMVLSKKNNINSFSKSGSTPIHLAAEKGYLDIIQVLINEGGDIELKDIKGRTCLICACVNGHTLIATYLIDLGADISVRDVDDKTALHHLCGCGFIPMNSITIERNKGYSSIHWNKVRKCLLLTNVFLLKGFDLEWCDKNGMTLLHTSCANGNFPMVVYLVENLLIDICSKDKNGLICIHTACYNGHFEIARYLIKIVNDRKASGLFVKDPLKIKDKEGHSVKYLYKLLSTY